MPGENFGGGGFSGAGATWVAGAGSAEVASTVIARLKKGVMAKAPINKTIAAGRPEGAPKGFKIFITTPIAGFVSTLLRFGELSSLAGRPIAGQSGSVLEPDYMPMIW